VKALGSAADVFIFGDGHEVAQLAEVEHKTLGLKIIKLCLGQSYRASLACASTSTTSQGEPMSINTLLAGKTLGFGTAPLGNMFRDIPEAEAQATVDAAWEQGTRYFDTAPFYGAGLAEIRLGDALAKRNRDDFVLSTKVGRLILDEVEDTSARDLARRAACSSPAAPTSWSTTTRPMPPCVRSTTASSA
jgi:hypothetical protein